MIYITTGSKDEAVMIGKALINAKLAVCVNIIENMYSMYMWDGKLQDDNETILIAKLLKPLGFKPTQKEISSSHFWLAESFYELTHPLRSSPITEPSTLLQDDPPPSCASILSPFVVLTYRVFS